MYAWVYQNHLIDFRGQSRQQDAIYLSECEPGFWGKYGFLSLAPLSSALHGPLTALAATSLPRPALSLYSSQPPTSSQSSEITVLRRCFLFYFYILSFFYVCSYQLTTTSSYCCPPTTSCVFPRPVPPTYYHLAALNLHSLAYSTGSIDVNGSSSAVELASG